jgi:hypothetical protein
MKARSSVRSIYLRLDSPSYEFLKAIRNGREVLAQPRSAIPIFHDLAYVADNMPNNDGEVLESVVNDVASTWPSLNLELTYPFRALLCGNREYETLVIPLWDLCHRR